MAVFFASLNGPLANLARYTKRVESDVKAFGIREFKKIMEIISDEGVLEIERMFKHMISVHYPKITSPSQFPAILGFLRDRHVRRWELAMKKITGTAIGTMPEARSNLKVRLSRRGPKRSILGRLDHELGGDGDEPDKTFPAGGREMFAVARLNRKKTHKILLRLVPHMKLMQRVTPINFQREFTLTLLKINRPRGQKMLIKISPGIGPRTCTTCRALQGRVMTQDAMNFALKSLSPPLFHPNCKHRTQTAGLQGVTQKEYDPSKHGEVVTLPKLHAMIGQGLLKKQHARRSIVSA